MKNILPFITTFLLVGFMAAAQHPDTSFNKQWHNIDSLIVKKDLTKTALAKVNKLFAEAKQKGLDAQVIKALLYKLSLQDKVSEDDINATTKTFDTEIAKPTNTIQQSILLVLKAAALETYYNEHRWNFRNRSTTANVKKDDITTWGGQDFYTAISILYTKALRPAPLLQQTGIQQYNAIIIAANTPELRPTMYDLLANRAIDFYTGTIGSSTEASDAFTLNDTTALSPAKQFMQHAFNAGDTTSRVLKALVLYQNILQYHAAHNDTAALIDADINRIIWVRDNAAFTHKDMYYKTALQSITLQYTNQPAAAQAWYLLANMQADKARNYKPFEDTTNRYAYIAARQLIIQRLKAQPKQSEGNSNMQQLLNEMEAKQLHTEIETVNIPNQAFRLLVQYKNVDTFYGRIISKKAVDGLRNANDDKFWKRVATLPYTGPFVQPLPQTSDYQQHKVEIKVDGLPAGEYVLLGSSTKNFADSTGRLLTQEFTVSHLSYIHKGDDYFVLDRESGKPLKGVSVAVTLRTYTNKWVEKKIKTAVTGKDGYFNITAADKKANSSGYLSITLTDGSDTLTSPNGDYYYQRSINNITSIGDIDVEKKNAYVDFYMDRAIYRPGQKIYFKGIAITQDAATHQPKLYKLTDSLHIYLKDVNDKAVDSLSLGINKFGSIAGSFVLPVHALTGSFRLTTEEILGTRYFRVEEYKRPTFYVQLDTLKTAYRLRDTITITGFAQAFAGNFLNNAQVKYNVQRVTRYNYYEWFGKRPQGNNKQIAEGTVTTDGTGKFTIKFLALPDETVDTATNPIFDFALNATVTDAGGETREANTSLSVGYVSLTVTLGVPGIIDNGAFKSIPVSVQNLSGKPVDANVRINICPLQSPGRAVHKRYWDRPDVFVMGKDEFIRNFPYDEYENESDVHTWQKLDAIVNDTLNVASLRAAYSLQRKALPQGWYKVEAVTTDKNGHEIKDVAYTEVYDASTATVPADDDNFSLAQHTLLHPGDKAALLTGSAFKDVYIIQQTDKAKQTNTVVSGVQAYKTFTLDANKKQIEEPVTEEDRGGFGIYYSFVKHNRFYTGGATFDVPWDNKQLAIQYTSFRNKTEPGSQEQWTVKIKGEDTGKAELLTAMYDASLDQFAANGWFAPNVWSGYYGSNNWQSGVGFGRWGSDENEYADGSYLNFHKLYYYLATKGDDLWYEVPREGELDSAVIVGTFELNGMRQETLAAPPPMAFSISAAPKGANMKSAAPRMLADRDVDFITSTNFNESSSDTIKFYMKTQHGNRNNPPNPPLQLRTNFNETAFFFPQVYADSAGNYNIQFTMPESLTKWKWLSLAHTQGLSFGTGEQTIVTQKTLMVQPNMPRFLREGDQIELTARISNVGDTALTGQASLELVDASTGNPVDGLFQNVFANQYFTAEAGQTTVVKFPVVIPNNYYHPLTYRVIAKTNGFNDGEENTLPVLTNRMLVTESLPLYVKGDTTKHFTFDKLLNNSSQTLQTQSLTVEYTANPIWTAVQSLPYLMEYPYECAEQTFNRLYGNTLAAFIIQQHPRIKQVFQQWVKDTSALLSNLEKNQALKQVLLAETPWVLDAQNEAQQKKNIALLFDVVAMGNNTASAMHKLEDMQQADGSFPWFKGGYADRYITQYILTGIGRLQQLHAVPAGQADKLNAIVAKALSYLDNKANEEYKQLIKYKAKLTNDNLSQYAIQYLYMRSYFSTVAINNKTAYNYFYQQAMKYWQHQSIYMRGMIALTLLRTNQQNFVAGNIYPSIMENAVATDERGMYFKDNQWGYYWYQAPIEQQALLIELAQTMAAVKTLHTQKDADELRTWLINQKQTTNWKTTKATADACYALLLNSGGQIDSAKNVTIQLGSTIINSAEQKTEAGTGYCKQVIEGAHVDATMGNITVDVHTAGAVKNTSPSWGAVYWQYLEDMDKITRAATPLSLHKQLFIEKNTSAGKVLTPVSNDSVLHVGDKVIVRIELKSDRDMEYLHLKDMRAASMEPQNVLSEYKWQDGLGYYESTKDAATDFFISNLPKGSYVFEYPVYITHIGTFSSGVAIIQCMYAPEFASHSEGVKIVVE